MGKRTGPGKYNTSMTLRRGMRLTQRQGHKGNKG